MHIKITAVLALFGALPLAHGQVTLPAISGYTYTSINLPPELAATNVQFFGLNNAGQVVGNSYESASGSRSFVYQAGAFTQISIPGYSSIEVFGINNHQQVVGAVGNGDLAQPGVAVGFIYDLSTSSYSLLNFEAQPNFVPSGINDTGQLVGTANNSAFSTVSGALTRIDAFGNPSISTYGNGLNNSGAAVGMYFNGQFAGFTFSDGTFTSLTLSGATSFTATGINNSGIIVGQYGSAGLVHSWLRADGTYSEVAFPGASETWLSGINDDGMLSGFYAVDGVPGFTGFVATPTAIPEPPAVAGILAAATFASMLLIRRASHQRARSTEA